MMPPGAVLSLEKVERTYGENRALAGVSFTVHRGEAVALLGPNGAGKTTTFRLLTGLVPPSAGSLEVFGLDPFTQRSHALSHVGAVVGSPGTLPYLKVSDLLEHVARVRGLPRAQVLGEVKRAAGEMGVSAHLGRALGSLSTGQERRVLLSAALVGDPEVLLLDEPTLGLDPVARADLRGLLKDLVHQGHTLLLSTHLIEDVGPLCSRVLFLKNGRLEGDEPVTSPPDGAIRLRLRFRIEVPEEALRRTLRPWGIAPSPVGPGYVDLSIPGGEGAQVEVLRALVASGAPLLEAERLQDDLTQRYLERIGREEE